MQDNFLLKLSSSLEGLFLLFFIKAINKISLGYTKK